MIINEIKCLVNISLGLVGGCIPCIPPCVRACSQRPLMICSPVELLQNRMDTKLPVPSSIGIVIPGSVRPAF